MDNNLYPYYVVLTTAAKDRRLKVGAKEKLSIVRRNVLTCVLARDPKDSPFSPRATVSCVLEKSLPVLVVALKILGKTT